jgi:hypothetical protein
MAEQFQTKVYMCPRRIKLGILLDSFDVPAWVDNAIRRVARENTAEFILVILNNAPKPVNKNNGNKIIYSIFNRIDEQLFTKGPNPFESKSIADLFSGLPMIKTVPIRKYDLCFFCDTDINRIKEYHLDVLIKFGFEGLQVDSLNLSKYGTWFYHHGDDRIMRTDPPGFLEVVENWPETSSALLAAGGKYPFSQVLFRSYFMTYPLSPARHRSYYFWATTTFLARQLSLLQRLGEEKYYRGIEKFNTAPPQKVRRYDAPSNFQAVVAIARIIARLIKEFIQRILYMKQWFLLFDLKDAPENFQEFVKIVPSKGVFWADPHVIQACDRYYIFIEEFLQTRKKGHISVIELDEQGNWKAPVQVLEKERHLSYPFIFQSNDKFYMVPESRADKTIDLYECTEFPTKWIFKQHLMENVSAVDSTLIHYAGKWWLFTAIAENEAAAPNVELFLFFREDIFSGEWKAHPQNPIVSDVKNARPAGSLFVKDERLFRPSQDCSKGYGHGIDLNEIVALTETEYRESKVQSIRPGWDESIVATHTYARCGNLTMLDAMTHTRRI